MKTHLLAAAALMLAVPAQAQYTAKEWPEGAMKQRFTETCGICHDINRIRIGYTPEGWLTVVRMMQNMDAPVAASEWAAMQDYLIKNFPERARPAAVIVDGPVKVNIRLWDVPTQGSRPHDPLAAKDGSICGAASSPTSSAASIRRPARSASTR
jgi:virginiamycin B lyase